MACKTSYELHHQFPRLAEESGFTFNTHRPRVHIDWNKIKLIDIDGLIRDRKFFIIEQHLNDILDCVFESEFDVRILDDGVMKMFRLAQLAVEYQQFCRHYLDRSVFVLREEITSLAHELDTTKKQLQEKEDEIRKLRKRSRHAFKTPLPYGNENIAAMILKTLSNKGDIFPSTSNIEALQYNKCSYCEKVFMNQLYLQSHITRRHAQSVEIEKLKSETQKEKHEANNENTKLSAEITELKAKLKEMEVIIANANKINTNIPPNAPNDNRDQSNKANNENIKQELIIERKNIKDAEVSTSSEDYLLNKFEEWKRQENEKYSKEMIALRNQIAESINTIKEQQVAAPKDSNIIEQLQNTIIQQGAEITALKHELNNTKLLKEKENSDNHKETEAQILFWTKRAEAQAKQYESLLQKLNEVAKDAKESRHLAESERERASQLELLLQRNLNKKASTAETSTDDLVLGDTITKENNITSIPRPEKTSNNTKTKQTADRQTLEHLHKKAQELLNVASISSSSIESSSPVLERNVSTVSRKEKTFNNPSGDNHKNNSKSANVKVKKSMLYKNDKLMKVNKTKSEDGYQHEKKPEKKPSEESRIISGSPMRIVRAKITEEVNNRLVSFGVDPLKSRLSQTLYQKQKQELQRLHDIKSKKNPMYEKFKYSTIASLDSSTEVNKSNKKNEYISPKKVTKPFRNFSSMMSNVKSKALSLVKLNENSTFKDKRSLTNGDVTTQSKALLQTPPMSERESPLKRTMEKKSDNVHISKEQITAQIESNKFTPSQRRITTLQNEESEDGSEESDIKDKMAIANSDNKSIENLIKSPARRPASADRNTKVTSQAYNIQNGDLFTRTQSAIDLTESKVELINRKKPDLMRNDSSDDIDSITNSSTSNKKQQSPKNEQSTKQTKGVLKHALSTSSLNKKKVLFDMDAIQMKSVSASPSQSITEKSDNENVTEQFELGLVNLESEDWDISSIVNEPLKNDTKIQVNTRASPKIAELKNVIESQLARRSNITSTAIVGGVDILSGPRAKPSSIGGSNTSLGSSILDDSESIGNVNHKAFVRPKKVTEKEDSELDISEFSIGLENNKIKNDF